MDIEHHNMWTPVILNWLKHIILWFQSYGCLFSECPNANALCAELYVLSLRILINDECNADAHTSYVQGHYSFITPQCSSTRSNCTSGSQTTNKQNVKVSISDYSKFTGLAKDWISFERKFRSVASLQGFEYVLQNENYEPVTENESSSYKLDSTFIYDAFQNSWADSMKFYLVEQIKPTKNGRNVVY